MWSEPAEVLRSRRHETSQQRTHPIATIHHGLPRAYKAPPWIMMNGLSEFQSIQFVEGDVIRKRKDELKIGACLPALPTVRRWAALSRVAPHSSPPALHPSTFTSSYTL